MELAWFSREQTCEAHERRVRGGSAYRGRALLALSLFKETRRTSGIARRSPSVIDKLGQEWPVFLHCEIHSLELNKPPRRTRRVRGAHDGPREARVSGRTLRSEVIGRVLAHFSIMNPMRVRLQPPSKAASRARAPGPLRRRVRRAQPHRILCVPTKNLMPVKSVIRPSSPPT